jgi:hypothetical protein
MDSGEVHSFARLLFNRHGRDAAQPARPPAGHRIRGGADHLGGMKLHRIPVTFARGRGPDPTRDVPRPD